MDDMTEWSSTQETRVYNAMDVVTLSFTRPYPALTETTLSMLTKESEGARGWSTVDEVGRGSAMLISDAPSTSKAHTAAKCRKNCFDAAV